LLKLVTQFLSFLVKSRYFPGLNKTGLVVYFQTGSFCVLMVTVLHVHQCHASSKYIKKIVDKQIKELLTYKGPTSYFRAIGANRNQSVMIIHAFIVTENSAINKISADVEFMPH
jgi:hypothetical protein